MCHFLKQICPLHNTNVSMSNVNKLVAATHKYIMFHYQSQHVFRSVGFMICFNVVLNALANLYVLIRMSRTVLNCMHVYT